ncbi:MAG: hypothetical protein AAFV49_08970 [Pseudomonadota bacterium]
MSPMDALERDIGALGIAIAPGEWAALRADLAEAAFPAGAVISSQARISEHWVFLSAGIAASEQAAPDGTATIARFFEAGQFCANLTSVWHRTIASDDLLAITDVAGVFVPDRIFRPAYLRGGAFGEYLRLKAMEAMLFDKDLICAKTSPSTEARLRFLEERHRDVVRRTPQKHLARFIGITPQGLSRFLRNRRAPAAPATSSTPPARAG